jgi:hypothetical protein
MVHKTKNIQIRHTQPYDIGNIHYDPCGPYPRVGGWSIFRIGNRWSHNKWCGVRNYHDYTDTHHMGTTVVYLSTKTKHNWRKTKMACFIAPMSLAIVTTLFRKKIPETFKIGWLNIMFWGGLSCSQSNTLPMRELFYTHRF